MSKEYQAKDPHLASYMRYVKILKEVFSTFDLIHVPKEQNSRAKFFIQDCKLEQRGKASISHLRDLESTKGESAKDIKESNFEVMQVTSTDSWMTTYI